MGRQHDATSTAISTDIAEEKPVFIVQDSTGGFWLMGFEGSELSAGNAVKCGAKLEGPVSVVASVVAWVAA